jgi:23S rRNA (cytidine1920-2'-O)/16S rRNA (cytidine1409-2'-O)-methyltransferase
MRIDKYLADKYSSRTKAAEAIEQGLVLVNGKSVNPSYEMKETDEITFCTPKELFVSNGGYKLSKALSDFNFSVKDKIIADIGASNGGFTDCLFQNGAKKVYCIDVGESQLDKSLKDKNVVIIDNFNARNLTADLFNETLDGVVIDVSFISLTYILQQVADVLTDNAFVIALIKPQFECQSKQVGKNGIVKDANVHKNIINKIYDFAVFCNLSPIKITNAPIKEGKNKEYLILLEKNGKITIKKDQILKYIKL